MAKRISNYESSRWARFLDWLENGGSALDTHMTENITAEANPNHRSEADHERIEQLLDEKHIESERLYHEKVHSWNESKGSRAVNLMYKLMSVAVCGIIIYVLLLSVAQLPVFGDPNSPVNNVVSQRYIEDGLEETGAVNIVAGMILDYRAFDTLGESHVLFVAACSVLMLLKLKLDKNGRPTKNLAEAEELNDRRYEPHNDVILQQVSNIIVPCILLFGIYVVLNGHLSAGGGFSGGAIMGAGLILYVNAHGLTRASTQKLFSYKIFKIVTFLALAFYSLSKSYSFFCGANGLETIIPEGTPGNILSAGLILPLNIAVGIIVAWTMYSFYVLFRKGDF